MIGSELCRRNDDLRIDQDLSGGQVRIQVRRDLSRPSGGATHVTLHPILGIEGVAHAQWTPWSDVLAEDNPHVWVQRIEQKFGWTRPSASATTSRSLTYRTLARLLHDSLNDRERPDVVSWNSRLGATPHDESWLSLFEGLSPLFSRPNRMEDPALWVVFRGGPAGVLVLSESGFAFRRDGNEPVDLMKRYVPRRRIEDVVADLLPQ